MYVRTAHLEKIGKEEETKRETRRKRKKKKRSEREDDFVDNRHGEGRERDREIDRGGLCRR